MRRTADLRVRVRNASGERRAIESLTLGFEWECPGVSSYRFLRHGWQSWSCTRARTLDAVGEPPFPSGEWLRGMHHGVGRQERPGWHQSDGLCVVASSDGGAACIVGAFEQGRAFALVHLRRLAEGRVAIELEQRLEVELEPGEQRELEVVRVAVEPGAEVLLERFAGAWGRHGGARVGAPFTTGWCSWYYFFHDVGEDDIRRNLEALVAQRESLPIEVVQIDDGYQRAVGDWLEPGPRFPSGVATLAREIRSAGFRAGIWTAPFCVVAESELHRRHPEWLLGDGAAPFLALMHTQWSHDGRVYALDPTRPAVEAHLRSLFSALVEMGFDYLKLDFLHAVAMRAAAASTGCTRAERLRRGLAAIRAGAGEDAFLLGCGSPLGPAVGLVDAMRIGPDVAPCWHHDDPGAGPRPVAIPGIEATLPSLANALRNVLYRSWMHRRLWVDDPDCLMVRRTDTSLVDNEIGVLSDTIAATGGMVVFSDDVDALAESDLDRLRRTIACARRVDASSPRVRGLFRADEQLRAQAFCGNEIIEADFDLAHRRSSLRLRPHAAKVAVFCDFDGTFTVQDVGSTLARTHLEARRAELWQRYERGECSAWEYNVLLFEGFRLPESELQAFLEKVELDPGARELVDFCARRDLAVQILSDGFDRNIETLQALHAIRFEYSANRLRYDDGAWHIEPGAPDSDCDCGTGVCKRGRIEAWRRAHPDALCVLVGNGRVSDLCGALTADRVFAKDSLAPALEAHGAAWIPFETLHDVTRVLREWVGD